MVDLGVELYELKPYAASRVVGKSDDVAWITQQPTRPLVEPHDPASAWRRFLRSIERILPIASLL